MGEEKSSWVRAYAPGSVANVGCGFDVFGFALEEPGDVVAARRQEEPGVVLTAVEGDGGRLPREAARNTAGGAAQWLLDNVLNAAAGRSSGVELRLEKGLPLASGLGSSAASAVAAAVAVDALFGLGLPRETLLAAAVEGERVGCGAAHGDNAAASLYGGFVLVRQDLGGGAFTVLELPVPEDLSCAVVRPHVEVDTGQARRLLGDRVGLREAVAQWGNTAAFVAGLYRGDPGLLRSALHDAVAEPLRSAQVPGFQEMKQAALAAGALGCSLSGSGPSTFALAIHRAAAETIGEAMAEALFGAVGGFDVFVSTVGAPGARVLREKDAPT